MDYPQKFCGQSQPHYPHRWSDGIGFSMYKNCAGYASEREERPCICSKNWLGYRMEANPKCPKHGISSEIEPPPDPEDTMTNEERVRAAVVSALEADRNSWQLHPESLDAITERVLEALNAKPLEKAWYRGPNFMMYLMDRDGVCLMSAPVNSPVVNGDTIQFPPIKVSL